MFGDRVLRYVCVVEDDMSVIGVFVSVLLRLSLLLLLLDDAFDIAAAVVVVLVIVVWRILIVRM